MQEEYQLSYRYPLLLFLNITGHGWMLLVVGRVVVSIRRKPMAIGKEQKCGNGFSFFFSKVEIALLLLVPCTLASSQQTNNSLQSQAASSVEFNQIIGKTNMSLMFLRRATGFLLLFDDDDCMNYLTDIWKEHSDQMKEQCTIKQGTKKFTQKKIKDKKNRERKPSLVSQLVYI